LTIELPLFRLGLAGFTADQQRVVASLLAEGAGEATLWEVGALDSADAWWINGARTQATGDERIRIASGTPEGRSLQVHLPDVDRPLGFARPLPPGFEALCSFDFGSRGSMKSALLQFEAWLAPLTMQYCLAAHIIEHQSALGSGRFELHLRSQLLAVVDMQGDVAVRPNANPADFEDAFWQRSASSGMPEHFARTSLAQLMWQYTARTQRDVLPKHYRTGLLYFRRAPRLPQRLLTDSHLLIMRELMVAPATFEQLQQRCGLGETRLARELASLYFVGSITSNPKRAARAASRPSEADSGTSTRGQLDSMMPNELPPSRRLPSADLTAPAPIGPR
jgi:hypothetical protein